MSVKQSHRMRCKETWYFLLSVLFNFSSVHEWNIPAECTFSRNGCLVPEMRTGICMITLILSSWPAAATLLLSLWIKWNEQILKMLLDKIKWIMWVYRNWINRGNVSYRFSHNNMTITERFSTIFFSLNVYSCCCW